MTERYDTASAAHYAAYRPPLHRLILRRALGEDARFGDGLDIGCGTGYSAIVLSEACERVVGVDPSPAMLERATPHDRITYLPGAGEALPVPDGSADVITFAGSLFYTDTPATHAQARRVARPDALAVVYDFDLDLAAPLASILPEPPSPETSSGANSEAPAPDAAPADGVYNHRINLTGRAGFAERLVRHETVPVPMSPSQLAHVLLSDSHRLDRLADTLAPAPGIAPGLSPADLHPMLTQTLAAQADTHNVPAKLYYAVYGVEGR